MTRSSRWRNALRGGSRNGSRPAPVLPAGVRLVPDPDNRLADGVLVEAQVRARLFGAPILRLDAEVVLSPARADVVPEARAGVDPEPAPAPVPARPARRPAANGAASVPLTPGSDLARALALVQQNARDLQELDRGTGRR